MIKKLLLTVVAALMIATGSARAGLVAEFAGFTTVVDEVGVSGLMSSYHQDTVDSLPVSGPTVSTALPALGPGRVTYPYGVGQVPSPGGTVGPHFDQGVLGVKVAGNALIIRSASGLNPLSGYYYSGWKTWYGQGDMFLSVSDSGGISHFALLNSWARDGAGAARVLNGGHFTAAREFHVGDGTTPNREGHLVRLDGDADVVLAGGTGAYNVSIAPDGLDVRAFVSGGTDLGDAALTHHSVYDAGQTWYVQTWAVDLANLSADPVFEIALHQGASCANDQIGLLTSVPEPAAALLGAIGMALFAGRGRRQD